MLFSHSKKYLIVLGLSVYTFINTIFCDVYNHFQIPISWYWALIIITTITLLTWEVNRISLPLLKSATAFIKSRRDNVIFNIVTTSFITSIVTIALIAVFHYFILDMKELSMFNPAKLCVTYTIVINLLFHLLNTITIIEKENAEKAIESAELKKMNALAELQAVKSQINPHFLFNNLNVLSSLILQEKDDANKFIEEFSKMYQYILQTQEVELVPLKKELEFLETYTYLLQKRFPNSLEIKINVADDKKDFNIVPISLQILIENAIKHNVVSKSRPLLVEINSNGADVLIIKNNMQQKMVKELSSRIGLQNIDKRYEMITGKNIVVIDDSVNFVVKLPLIKTFNYASLTN
jgi:two-component system, LytTR family, sensor kinase